MTDAVRTVAVVGYILCTVGVFAAMIAMVAWVLWDQRKR